MDTSAVRLRRVSRPVWVVALAVVVGLIAAAIAVAVASDSGSDRSNGPSKSPATTPSTLTPTTTATTTVPAPTTTTLAAGEDRLSSASRLGYAGLGPIKLGMTFSEAERAGPMTIGHKVEGCPIYEVVPAPDSGLTRNAAGYYTTWIHPQDFRTEPYTIDEIDVSDPAIYTISAVHVGSTFDEVLRTYPAAVERIEGQLNGQNYVSLTITNPEGRSIRFYDSLDRVVAFMILGLTPETADNHAKC